MQKAKIYILPYALTSIDEVSSEAITMKELNECTIEELKDLARQGQRFEQVKEEWNKTSDKLSDIAKELNEIARQINPLLNVKHSERKEGSRGERAELVSEIYEKMVTGLYVTRDFLEKMNPDKDAQWISNTMSAIKKLPNVKKTKDGTKMRLFI